MSSHNEERGGRIVGSTVPHESARGHVTGEALYTDDLFTQTMFPARRQHGRTPPRAS